MPSVFISYRHEDDAHCDRVREMAEFLESRGVDVILDVLANERDFDYAGPPENWTLWSVKQAECREHKILIVASNGWFRCFEGKEKPGVGMGAATEANSIRQRLAQDNWYTKDIRPVVFDEDRDIEFPPSLAGFGRFIYAQRRDWIVAWLRGRMVSQQSAGRVAPGPDMSTARKEPGGTSAPEVKTTSASPRPQQVDVDGNEDADESLSHEDGTLTRSASLLRIAWRTVTAGPYQRGFTKVMISSVLNQIADPRVDRGSVASVLEAEPSREIIVPEFQVSREPVTNSQFRRFVDSMGYRTTAERNGEPESWRDYATPDKADHPVVQVSFEDAQAFCQWAAVRLPTLDEWMKAYRGPNGNIYPWGNKYDSNKCNTAENKAVVNTSAVDMFAACASHYGCYDMIGNVHEWVDASGETGPLAENVNPAAIEHLKRTRAVMGGAWSVPCQTFGLPVVNMLAALGKADNDLGFRVARTRR